MHLEVFDNHLVCEVLYHSWQVVCPQSISAVRCTPPQCQQAITQSHRPETLKTQGKFSVTDIQAKLQLAHNEWSLCHISKTLSFSKRK